MGNTLAKFTFSFWTVAIIFESGRFVLISVVMVLCVNYETVIEGSIGLEVLRFNVKVLFPSNSTAEVSLSKRILTWIAVLFTVEIINVYWIWFCCYLTSILMMFWFKVWGNCWLIKSVTFWISGRVVITLISLVTIEITPV